MDKLHSRGFLFNRMKDNRKLSRLNRLSNNQVRHRSRRKEFAFCYLATINHWSQLTCTVSLLMSHPGSGDGHRGSTTTTRSSEQFVSRKSGIWGEESRRRTIGKCPASKCGIRADTVHLTTTICDSFCSPAKLLSVGLRAGRSVCVIELNCSLDLCGVLD